MCLHSRHCLATSAPKSPGRRAWWETDAERLRGQQGGKPPLDHQSASPEDRGPAHRPEPRAAAEWVASRGSLGARAGLVALPS